MKKVYKKFMGMMYERLSNTQVKERFGIVKINKVCITHIEEAHNSKSTRLVGLVEPLVGMF